MGRAELHQLPRYRCSCRSRWRVTSISGSGGLRRLRCLEAARRRRPIEPVDVVLAVLDAVPQDVDDAALANFALQTRRARNF